MKEFSLILIYLIKICYLNRIFNITISNKAHHNESNITIIKGKYKTLYAIVNIDEKLIREEKFTNSFTTISLDNNLKDFKLLNDNFTIDITEGNIFQFELGISCNSNIDLNKTYTIVLLSSDPSFFINEFYIQIKKENYLQLNTINNSKFLLYIIELEKIKNVDDLKLNINKNEKAILIKSYNDISLLLDTYNGTEFNITTENTCFNTINIRKIKTNSFSETDFKGIFFQNSILSMKIEDSPIINSLKISLDFDLNGVLLFCSLTEINNVFLNQSEVISQKKKKGYYNIYKFQKESGEKLILFFDNLNIYKEYKMICYFKSINNYNLDYENLTFGNFPNSDYKINLRPKYSINNINPANCINFNFNNLTEKEEDIFTEKIIKFCQRYFLTNQKRIWNKCIKRNFNHTFGICVISTNNNTRKDDYKTKFNNFTSEITKENLKSKLNISDSIIEKYNNFDLENDNEEPNPTNITFLNFILENNIVKFESMNNNSNIQCYTLFTNRILENIEPIDFKDFIIIKKEKKFFEINIPNELNKEKINLNLIFQCYNLPNFTYHYLHSSPFIVLQIFNNILKTSSFKSFPNCNDLKNKFVPQCFNISSNLTLNISLVSILLQNYLNYEILTSQQQNKDNLLFEIENLKKNFVGKTKNEDLEKYLFTFSIQLYLTKCSNYIDYDYCFNEKIKIIKEIINQYNTTLLNEKKNSSITSFNRILLLFYYFTINVDSFSYENTRMLIKIIYDFLLNHSDLNDSILSLYYYILNNLISSITFSQFQKNNFETDKNNIIKDDLFSLIPFLLKKLCHYNRNITNFNAKFDNFNYFKLEKKDSPIVYYNDSEVYIEIPIPKNKQDSRKMHYYCIVQYINYPLFNYRKKDEYYNKVYQISFIEDKKNEDMKNFEITNVINLTFKNPDKNIFCYFFDYKEKFMKNKTDNVHFTKNEVITYRNYSKNNYLKCLALQFGDITIGKNDINGIIITDNYGIWNIIILIILIILLIFVLVIIIIQKRKNNNNCEIIKNEEFTFSTIIKSDI